jgi:hypothetical protein
VAKLSRSSWASSDIRRQTSVLSDPPVKVGLASLGSTWGWIVGWEHTFEPEENLSPIAFCI